MIDYSKIKIVIWDLDETFWEGIFSEGPITPISDNIQLVKDLTDIGIVNSVCSKNDKEPTERKLSELGVDDYFVFNSIDWNPKGQRINKMLKDMGLRAENALFIDDNHLNLEEAKYFNEEIMVGMPDEIPSLIEWVSNQEKKDLNHKRLNQYKILEEKAKEKEQIGSNEEFLLSSNIKVDINTDCKNEIDRLSEMIMRTNQLNFTKNRMEKDELIKLINEDGVDSGYVSAKDRFGDYGIIGMYVVKDNALIHFLFSCRTIGMGIEQYVYAKLGYPKLEVVGTVIGEVDESDAPAWINQEVNNEEEGKEKANDARVLVKGPCDLKALFSYIDLGKNSDTEFTFINERGVSDEQINHTTHIVEAKTLSTEQKDTLFNELPFADKEMYSDLIYRKDYDVVFISILNEANLGLYKRKKTGEIVAFTEEVYPMTDKDNWDGYIEGKRWTGGCNFTKDFLEEFSDKYEFLGRITVDDFRSNLEFIRNNLPKETLLVIMLGSETQFEQNEFAAYKDREKKHKEYNDVAREFSKNKENTTVLDVNNYISGQESFYKNINHFIPKVYYEMAQDMIKLINDWTGQRVAKTSFVLKLIADTKQRIRKLLGKR